MEHSSIGKDLISREMITAYATLKKAAANANYASRRLARNIPGCISSVPLTIPENSRRRQVRRCGVEITCCT
jgi:fumarate hydratase class II